MNFNPRSVVASFVAGRATIADAAEALHTRSRGFTLRNGLQSVDQLDDLLRHYTIRFHEKLFPPI